MSPRTSATAGSAARLRPATSVKIDGQKSRSASLPMSCDEQPEVAATGGDRGDVLGPRADVIGGGEAAQHVLPREHAPRAVDQVPVERQVARAERGHPVGDLRLAGGEVDRRTGDGQRVQPLRPQRGVDRGQPSALAVADQVRAAPHGVDRAVDHGDVVLDAAVLRLLGGADPVQGEQPGQPRCLGHLDLALLGAVVDDAGVVAGLRRQHQRRDDVFGRAVGEVLQPRDGRRPDDRVRARHVGGRRSTVSEVRRARSSGGRAHPGGGCDVETRQGTPARRFAAPDGVRAAGPDLPGRWAGRTASGSVRA